MECPDDIYSVWNAWLKETPLAGEQRADARRKAVKWAYISVMIATAIVCSYVAASNVPVYQGVIRLGIALGAIVTMFASLHGRLSSFTVC